jgi:deferrochelatase/peroxidase EfeB
VRLKKKLLYIASSSEIAAGKSDPKLERGLAFVSYQSQIDQGFRFIQTRWENDPKFVPGKNVAPGWDPIMGEANGAIRWFTGADPNNPTAQTGLPMDFVVSRGGEYFFSPSISAIRNFISV